MSIQFNNASGKGLVQLYETELGFSPGDVSGDDELLGKFTVDANLALDDFWSIAIPASGHWQLDDSNQTDYPIIRRNLVDGQRDYPLTTDEGGNLILDIYRVFILSSATATAYQEIFPTDQQSDQMTSGFWDGRNTEGIPASYDKTADGIFLDPIPSYNATLGLKVMINREASYFTTGSTTKMPGVPGNLHKYFYLKPAAEYARRHNRSNADSLAAEVAKMEGTPGHPGTIEKQFAFRSRDERKRPTMRGICFR